jgi:release factor glutamine methyltransferase
VNGVGALLGRAGEMLHGASDSPHSDASLLLAHALSRPREWLAAHPEATVDPANLEQFFASCERRRRGTPIAYILGHAGFYGREFFVDESVLVPRPETEHLIDAALRLLRRAQRDGREPAVLDVGTGSGAIACTIAAETGLTVDATDVSPAALRMAARNAAGLDVGGRCRFYQGDLAASVAGRRYDLLVANLPYVPTRDLPVPPDSAGFEPRQALDGGTDGLECYRRLLRDAPALLVPGGTALLEAAPPTIAGLAALARSAFPDGAIEIGSDYAGLARYVGVEAPHAPSRPAGAR